MSQNATTEKPEMEKIAADVANERFFRSLETDDGRTKLADGASTYIRQRLREESFARKIINPVPVTKAEVQRATTHDTVEKICEIEYDSDKNFAAQALNLVSQPTSTYVRTKRFAVRFYKIETQLYEKNETELYAYEMPIIKMIEENSIKDIQRLEDKAFIGHVDAIFDNPGDSGCTQIDATAGSANQFDPGQGSHTGSFDRIALSASFAAMNGKVASEAVRELRAEIVLVSEQRFTNLLNVKAVDVGSDAASKILVEGYSYDQILQRKLITTTKVDVCLPKYFYVFTDQRFFGHFFVLNGTKFWIKKEADMIQWKTWEVIGMGFGNIRACMRVEIGA